MRLARYPYVETASGGKPIVWVELEANGLTTPAPATFVPRHARSALAPRAARAVEYSDAQAISLQLLTRQGTPFGPPVTVVPEIDDALDDPVRVRAPGPWFQYEQILLAQDFLEHFTVIFLGPRQFTAVLLRDEEEAADEEPS